MDNPENVENTVDTPLLKEKKTRPPQSEKQKEAFKKARERLLENRAQKKEGKILDAKRTLLEKEGYLPVKKNVESLTPQFDINEDEPLEPTKAPAPNTKRAPAIKSATGPLKEEKKRSVGKPKKEPRVILSESEDGDSDGSSSSEEVIVIKRTRKPKGAKPAQKKEESDEDEIYTAAPDYSHYFC